MPRTPKVNTTPTPETSDAGSGKALPIIIVLSSLLLVALSVAGYFYYQYRQSPKVQSAEEIKGLKEEIGAIFELPTDEEPTLATVTDRNKLAEQPFFQKAENGDKVLIYSASGRAVLYRPSAKKIIDVTTVNVNQPAPTTEVAPVAPSQPETAEAVPAIVRIALLNGSRTVGATNALEARLKTLIENGAVISKEKATRDDYQGITVVDLSGQNGSTVTKLATDLGGSVAALPEGEVSPTDADVLIVVGNE